MARIRSEEKAMRRWEAMAGWEILQMGYGKKKFQGLVRIGSMIL
jgi:hypothetical protein